MLEQWYTVAEVLQLRTCTLWLWHICRDGEVFLCFPIFIAADTLNNIIAVVLHSQGDSAVDCVVWHCGSDRVLSLILQQRPVDGG